MYLCAGTSCCLWRGALQDLEDLIRVFLQQWRSHVKKENDIKCNTLGLNRRVRAAPCKRLHDLLHSKRPISLLFVLLSFSEAAHFQNFSRQNITIEGFGGVVLLSGSSRRGDICFCRRSPSLLQLRPSLLCARRLLCSHSANDWMFPTIPHTRTHTLCARQPWVIGAAEATAVRSGVPSLEMAGCHSERHTIPQLEDPSLSPCVGKRPSCLSILEQDTDPPSSFAEEAARRLTFFQKKREGERY